MTNIKQMTPDDLADSNNDDKESAFSNFASGLLEAEEKDKQAKKEILKEGVERLEDQEGKLINSSRLLTSELSKLREQADMSPFVGTSGKINSPRFKRGEFIEILAREILWIGREELKDRGSIISVQQLRQYFSDQRENWNLRDKDIPEALTWLDKEELIPNLDQINDETELIYFRPIELSSDTRDIIKAAIGIDATRSKLQSILGWSEERVDNALRQLEEDGIAILDGNNVYFPGI